MDFSGIGTSPSRPSSRSSQRRLPQPSGASPKPADSRSNAQPVLLGGHLAPSPVSWRCDQFKGLRIEAPVSGRDRLEFTWELRETADTVVFDIVHLGQRTQPSAEPRRTLCGTNADVERNAQEAVRNERPARAPQAGCPERP